MGIPRSPGIVVDRHRLLRRLDALLPLTLVRGLSGTGKTTLVASWLRGRLSDGDETCWINAADNPSGASLPTTIEALLSATARRLIVVIDDAHYLDDAAVAGRLCDLVAAHDSLHLVVCSRVVHPVKQLARDRRIAFTALTGRDLNATVDELPLLAQAWGHRLDQDEIGELVDRVGGWLAPLRIALDSADPTRDPGGFLAASRYLRDHVLPQVSEDTHLVSAMTLSLADDVTEPLARALFIDEPHSPGLLHGLEPLPLLTAFEHQGLLDRSPRPDGTDAWHFPALIAEILADTFTTQHPDLARHAHRVIADNLPPEEEQQQGGRIIRHARAAEHWPMLNHMWTTHGLCLATTHPEETCLAYDDLPDPVLAEFPSLAVAASVVASLRHQDTHTQRAALIRSYADAGWALPFPSRRAQPDRMTDTMAITSQIIADRVSGDTRAAVMRAQEHGCQILGESAATPTTGTTRAWFELQSALSSFADGDWLSATNQLASAMTTARTAGAHFIVSAAAAHRAMISAIVGHTDDAHENLATHRSIDTSHQWLHRAIAGPAHVAEALLRLDRLDPTAADHLALAGDGTDSFEEWATLTWARARYALLYGNPVVAASEANHVAVLHESFTRPHGRDQLVLDRVFAELLLALGELNRAQRHLSGLDPHRLQLAVPRARLALISGNYTRARSLAVANAWDPHMVMRDRAELLMIKAAAALAMDEPTSAADVFTSAHQLCHANGILLPYASLPKRVLRRLLHISGITLPPEAVDALASCREMYPEHGELVTLTTRETTILYAMVEHDTLADIATALTVSLNTVKKQAAAIYTKLGVHDRAAALLRAHQLGLLPPPLPSPGSDLNASA